MCFLLRVVSVILGPGQNSTPDPHWGQAGSAPHPISGGWEPVLSPAAGYASLRGQVQVARACSSPSFPLHLGGRAMGICSTQWGPVEADLQSLPVHLSL